MFSNVNHPPQRQPPPSGESMLAACLAAIATLLLAPLVVNMTHGLVLRWAEHVYGELSSASTLVSFAHDLLVWPTVFFALKTSIQTAVMAGAVGLALRFI